MGQVLESKTLASEIMGEGTPLILLHGLFASKSNLRLLAKRLAEKHQVHALDLPLHGGSRAYLVSGLDDMALAVEGYIRLHGLDMPVLVGHSLGGKVAMSVALRARVRISQLIVVDIAPVAYMGSHGPVFSGIKAVAETRCNSRAEARAILADFISETMVQEFLLTQLRRSEDEGAMQWVFDWKGLEQAYVELLKAPGAVEPTDTRTLLIRGALSDYVTDEHLAVARTLFPRSRVLTFKGVGHWLHAEKPDQFVQAVLQFLASESK
jgi:esterase